PSPPAVAEPPFFADDPVDPGAASAGPVVAPAGGATSWSEWLAPRPDRADWAAERWLAGPRHLPAAPGTEVLAATRTTLHRLAAHVIAPARHAATGRFGLRWTLGGFGTPFFVDGAEGAGTGTDRQIRVVGTTLVDQWGGAGGEARTTPITTLADAAAFLATAISPGVAAEHDTPPVGDPYEPLAPDQAAAAFLGAWFGMGFAALEALRADAATVDPTRPQLWPGHFDPAIEAGDSDHRASYGASPGDPASGERPYLYVSVWYPDRLALGRPGGTAAAGEPWNATSFTGSILPLDRFPPGADPTAVALDFYTSTRDRLDAVPRA
ncbi:MAG: hypothetical protein OEW29_10095, partial [Acidimicrobiia bacterium]|nr:hypothetical protein [Acidimicrobiia bacterium]